MEKMKKIKRISRSSFNRLPDEIVLEILSKLTDLKTLCICRLVSRRFFFIVVKIDAISYTAPLVNPSYLDLDITGNGGFTKKLFWYFINGVFLKPLNLLCSMLTAGSNASRPPVVPIYGQSFVSALWSLMRFRGLKYLSIELPDSGHQGVDDRSLFKWMVRFGTRLESYVFLWPNSVCDSNGLHVNGNGDGVGGEEEGIALRMKKVNVGIKCVMDVLVRRRMLLGLVCNFPLLERVCITDSGKRGRVSLSGGEVGKVRDWLFSSSETPVGRMNIMDFPGSTSEYHVPILHLPVSGFVMKGITLVVVDRGNLEGGNDSFVNEDEDGFGDEMEAVYSEAVMEILKSQRGRLF
ncbi:hypothetical protein OSB04_030237 [Centaurea solstitialis]|uniref:F-box domain-containing protein n=1 Tax=Centaurea solstitialis TaxID=347529 RepID=A0AA38S8E2_9ASTR|nr:hypothetical protein OSB04_030237 [Centaurea solstitialis]